MAYYPGKPIERVVYRFYEKTTRKGAKKRRRVFGYNLIKFFILFKIMGEPIINCDLLCAASRKCQCAVNENTFKLELLALMSNNVAGKDKYIAKKNAFDSAFE